VLGLLVTLSPQPCWPRTIAFYVVIYTMWLKRSTPQNIVIAGPLARCRDDRLRPR